VAALALATGLLAGCLGEPEIEDRWTRVDVRGSSPAPFQVLPGGSTQTITVSADVTFRSILTGFAVAELRASNGISGADVVLAPDAPRVPMAEDIDRILAGSVSLGRATRAVTGWDHLIQRIDFTFTATMPAGLDSTAVPGAPAGLFLVCYLGEGEEVEQADGSDSLIVTPFVSGRYQILPVGMELGVANGGS
jgi:hypothetical protein